MRTNERLMKAWTGEREAARAARIRGDLTSEWRHLERAHIRSQPMVGHRIRTHRAMVSCGARRHDRREVADQLLRLLLAGPASITGRYPAGNAGGADVSAFRPMPIAEDLRTVLEGLDTREATR